MLDVYRASLSKRVLEMKQYVQSQYNRDEKEGDLLWFKVHTAGEERTALLKFASWLPVSDEIWPKDACEDCEKNHPKSFSGLT